MTRALIVLLAIAVIMVDGFDLQSIGFVAPEIARSWSIDIAAFGPVFSAGLAGSMVGAMSAGAVTRQFGLRSVLVMSLLVFGCGTLATAWVGDLFTLTALRFIVGLGLGAAVPVVMTIVADNSPVRFRATLMVVTLCGQPVGAILGGALCAYFIPIHGWQFAFYLGGILPVLLIGVVLLLLRNGTVPVRSVVDAPLKQSADRWRDLFGSDLRTTTVLLWACTFLGAFFAYIIVNWLPSSARSAGYSLETSVLAISLFNFGGIGGGLLLGALMDRYGPLKVMPPAFALAAASMAMLDLSRSVPALFLSASFVSGLAGYGGVMSLGPLTIMLYPPALRTMGTGWVMGIGRLGAAIGPLGAGLALAAGLGIGRLFYFAAAAAILVMLCLRLLDRMIPGFSVRGVRA
jgi:AAHS family 4-hydroxybenzoate transporter-like MFS transporter